MKIAIGYILQDGPWGGGNSFAASLARYLLEHGHRVVFDLADPDIDIILLTDPRSRAPTISFGAGAIIRYLAWKNPNAIVVHRINECDERKNGHGMNARLRLANYCADHTVFIASWLKELAVWRGGSHSIILNGADDSVFHNDGYAPWDGSTPLKLITHHWGGNWMKGFDVYEMLDRMLGEKPWKERLKFTYIGNLPAGFRFRNARYLEAMSSKALADRLRTHHVYVTASINEPAGMHHVEGASCGLPLLYRNSGALPEYCNGAGEAFEGPGDFVVSLTRMMERYDEWRGKMRSYPHTAKRMCSAYTELFEELTMRREKIAQRRLFRSPYLFLRNQIPI